MQPRFRAAVLLPKMLRLEREGSAPSKEEEKRRDGKNRLAKTVAMAHVDELYSE
jgi:hypothetical protein